MKEPTDAECFAWLDRHVSYLEHCGPKGEPCHMLPGTDGVWPRPQDEEPMTLREYIASEIHRGNV